MNLDRWVTHGELPPPSRYPRLDDGTAVPPGQVLATFEKSRRQPSRTLAALLSLRFRPAKWHCDARTAARGCALSLFGARRGRGRQRTVRRALTLPNAASGDLYRLESAPCRHRRRRPDSRLGWGFGGTLLGATIPFAATREASQAAADPRPSIAERYGSRETYLAQVRQAAEALMQARYIWLKT